MRAYQQKKLKETEEIDVSFADQNVAANEKSCQTEVKSFGKMCTQTDVLRRKVYHASSQTEDFDYLFTSNKKVVEILNFVFELVSLSVSRRSQSLSPFEELVLVLIKLRLDVPFQDLAYRFNISVSTVSRTFHSWLMIMDMMLS